MPQTEQNRIKIRIGVRIREPKTETETESRLDWSWEFGVLELEALGLKYFTGNLRKRNPTAHTQYVLHISFDPSPRVWEIEIPKTKSYNACEGRTHHRKIEKSDPHSRTATFWNISSCVRVYGSVWYFFFFILFCFLPFFFGFFVSHPHPGSQSLSGVPISRVTGHWQPEQSVRSLYNNDKMALNHKIYMCPGI